MRVDDRAPGVPNTDRNPDSWANQPFWALIRTVASRLAQTATRYPGAEIIRGSEAYASKQCGKCGMLNDKLRCSRTFSCGSCDAKGDRDVHAARNILLWFLSFHMVKAGCETCRHIAPAVIVWALAPEVPYFPKTAGGIFQNSRCCLWVV
jgi:hypothetical protein